MNIKKIFLVTIMSGSLIGCGLPPCRTSKFFPDTLPVGKVGEYYSAIIYNVGFPGRIEIENGMGEVNSRVTREGAHRLLAMSPDRIYFPDYGLTYKEDWDDGYSLIEIKGIPTQPINHELEIVGHGHGIICELDEYSESSKKYELKIEAN